MNFLKQVLNDAQNQIKEVVQGQLPQIPKLNSTTQADNEVNLDANAIGQILKDGQSFKSLMNRGITYQNFDARPWNQNFPYRLIVYEAQQNGSYTIKSVYRLPINPQSMTISTPFATKVTVTSRGILEESNGTPLKSITIRGTTGIFLGRGSNGLQTKPTSFLGTIFAGTTQAIANVRSAIATIAPNADSQFKPDADTDLKLTGYFQYKMLELFLLAYSESKSRPNGKSLRLGLHIPKDQVIYLVSPQIMTNDRSVASPHEYPYTLQLLAWATIDLKNASGFKRADDLNLIGRSVSDTQKLLNSLRNLRRVVSSFKDVVTAVRADIESNIMGPIRDVILTAKEITATAKTIADFPTALQTSFQSTIVNNWDALKRSASGLEKFDAKMNNIKLANASSSSTNVDTGFKSDVLNNLDLTDSITLSNIPMTSAQQASVDDAITNALRLNQNDYLKLASELQKTSDLLEPQIKDKDPLDDEWDILYALQDSITRLIGITADGSTQTSIDRDAQDSGDPARATTALAYWEQSADANDITFNTPLGKFLIPFPFKGSLEWIAQLYLGDATRWLEIAAVNNLLPPYVDEEGFTYTLLSNGSGNQFNISSSVNLFVNQVIYLTSATQLVNKRKILKIEEITSTNFQITVDGEDNLSIFTTVDVAKMKAYLPNTTNSMRQIYIPVNAPPNVNELNTRSVTFIRDDLDLVKFSKIDFLLDNGGDLAVSESGFLNLAFGKTNLIQAAKMKMLVAANKLLYHPDYGAGVEVGTSQAEINTDELRRRIDNAFIADSRYNAPEQITITRDNGVIQLDVVASISKDDGPLPLSVPLE